MKLWWKCDMSKMCSNIRSHFHHNFVTIWWNLKGMKMHHARNVWANWLCCHIVMKVWQKCDGAYQVPVFWLRTFESSRLAKRQWSFTMIINNVPWVLSYCCLSMTFWPIRGLQKKGFKFKFSARKQLHICHISMRKLRPWVHGF